MASRTKSQTRLAIAAVAGLSVALAVGASAGTAKTKPKAKGTTIDITQAGGPVPDAVGTTAGVLTSTIEVNGAKLRGLRIRDVGVTLQTTGSAAGAASHLRATLTSPDGATVSLLPSGMFGPSIGPLTFDDESRVQLQPGAGGARDPTQLASPYQGTTQPNCALSNQGCALSAMDGPPPTGTWTLKVFDLSPAGGLTSTLDSWRLKVVAGPPARVLPANAKQPKPVIATGANPTDVPIPDGTATTNGMVSSTITLAGDNLAGLRIRDVNATLQTTGTAAGAGLHLQARLISPNNTATWLIGGDTNAQSVGPLTLDDETFVTITSNPAGRDVTRLTAPYNGTAQPDCFLGFGLCGLFVLDNGPVAGEWTLLVSDQSPAGPATSTLTDWSLRVKAGRPYRKR